MHNFKKTVRAAAVACVLLALLFVLDFLLYPCTFTRNDIHAVITQTYDDVYVGTSHGKMGIDPESMEAVSGRTGHNLCVGGEYSVDVYYLVKLMIETGHAPSRLVYEISWGYFISEKEEGNNYLLFYHEFPLSAAKISYFWDCMRDCNFRTMLFPWYEYSLSYELGKLGDTASRKWNRDYGADDLKSASQEYHESGFVERYPVDTSSLSMETLTEFREEDVSEQNMEYLKKLIALCEDEGIELIALVTPVPEATLSVYADSFAGADQFFGDFFAEYGVRYVNFNGSELYGAFTHDISAFTDYDGHLNGDAARDFSAVLAQVLDGTYVSAQESGSDVNVFVSEEAVG